MPEIYNQDQEFNLTRRGLTPLPQPHLTGMKLKADIVLGDFVFNTIDEYGVTWVVTDIEGWWQHPEPIMPSIPRGLGDGDYDIKGRYNARILTLTGSFLTQDPALAEAARDRLIAATDLVYRGAYLKTGTDEKRSSFVRLSGGPQISNTSARGRHDFSIGLKAADPIKYFWDDSSPDGQLVVEIPATNRTTGATGVDTVVNVGNSEVHVDLEISGPITGPARVYNSTTDKLLYIVSSLRGRQTSSIVNKQLAFNADTLEDIVTLTTRTAHGLLLSDIVTISGLSEVYLNGDFEVTSVPTSTTFTFSLFPNVAQVLSIVSKKLQSTVATLTTRTGHGFSVGNSILIEGVDVVFNGTYTLTSVTSNTLSFLKNRVPPRSVSGSILVSNIATLTTTEAHQFIEGETVTISNINVNYNGSYTITSINSDTTFSYALTRTNNRAITNRSLSNDVASITMSGDHGFVVNEAVEISGINDTFNGTYIITTTPTSNTFTYAIQRSSQISVAVRALFSNIVTLTLNEAHGFSLGEQVAILNVGASYDGSFTVIDIPSSTTFSYARSGTNETAIALTTAGTVVPTKRTVVARQLIGSLVTITTASAHGFFTGETATIASLGAPFDGSYVITSVPSTNTFTYSKAAGNIVFGIAGAFIATRGRTGSTVTVTTASAHNLISGQYANITNMDSAAAALNGTYIVNVINATSFSYTTTTTGEITTEVAATLTSAIGGSAAINRTIASAAVTAAARVGGSIPFTAVNGAASVGADILSETGGALETSGFAVKKADIPFTPGITGATVDFGPDILEVNTQTRDVALNGSFDGARAKLDVLTDFIYLAPGNNEIQFIDEKNSVSQALLKIYYRSGWLG